MAILILASILVLFLLSAITFSLALASSRKLRRRWLLFCFTRASSEHARQCARERADYDCARRAAESAKAEAEAKQKGRLQHITDLTKSITELEEEMRDKANDERRRQLSQRQSNVS